MIKGAVANGHDGCNSRGCTTGAPSVTVVLQTCSTLRDASTAVGRDPSARFLGGGTLLVRAINEGTADFSTLVRCTDGGLTELRASGSRVRIGAGVTMSRILATPELAFLRAAARSVGGPAVRAQATVGGNLFAPPPYGDFSAALLALDARVSVQTGYSPRDMPIEEFLRSRDSMSQAVVAGVEVARPRGERSFRFLKVSKVRPKGVSVLTIAARLEDSAGRLSGVRVAYANMAPAPMRAAAVERALEGRRLERPVVEAAAAVAAEGSTPPTDAIASAWYRREVAPVHLSRLLFGAA